MLTKSEADHVWVNGRPHYLTPGGEKYPGVIRVLSATKGDGEKAALQSWRNRVGEEGANRILKAARANGMGLHAAIAAYFTGQTLHLPKGAVPPWGSVYPELRRMSDVQLIEGAVWHPHGYAGRVDCVARYAGELATLDWKTPEETKKSARIKDYFLRTAAYCAAVNHMYGLKIARTAVIRALPHERVRVFEVKGRELKGQWQEFQRRLEIFKQGRGERRGAAD